MNNALNSLIDSGIQCWGCDVFASLFQIVSDTAGAIYDKFATFCIVLFCVLFAFFVINAVWKNFKSGASDPLLQKSVQPVVINALVALGLLGLGVSFPRLVTTFTFEPAADIALVYTQSMIQQQEIDISSSLETTSISDKGFFRPALRNSIINLMGTTISQFKAYMKLGIAVMDKAFEWKALLGIGSFLKHIILFGIGLFLLIYFFELFLRFCFYFADIIVAMTFFAFFFPLSLVMLPFSNAENVPEWMSGLGKSLGAGQIKNLVGAIISLASCVITYTLIILILAKYFTSSDTPVNELMELITTGQVFSDDLSDENIAAMGLMGCLVLVYLLRYISSQIPEVTKMILQAFSIQENTELSKTLGDSGLKLGKKAFKTIKDVGTLVISGGEKNPFAPPSETKSDKPEAKKK